MFVVMHVLNIVVLLSALHLYKNIRSQTQHDRMFDIFIYCFILHNVFDIISTLILTGDLYYISSGAPFGLIYGPLLYHSKVKIHRQFPYKHYIPLFVVFIIYLLFVFHERFRIYMNDFYYVGLYSLIIVSWGAYSIFILFNRHNIPKQKIYLIHLSHYFILSSIFMILLMINEYEWGTLKEIFGAFVSLLMFIACLIMFSQSFHRFREYYLVKESRSLSPPPAYFRKKTHIGNDKHKVYLDTSVEVFEDFFTSQHISNPSLDIKTMSKILNMPQKELLYAIKQYHNTSFKKTLAIKRIELACQLILSKDFKDSYDSLYMCCGFNSKATFYRNFQQIKGCSPSQYKASI